MEITFSILKIILLTINICGKKYKSVEIEALIESKIGNKKKPKYFKNELSWPVQKWCKRRF